MAAKTNRAKRIKNDRGSVMVETIPLLAIFVVLLGFGIGFFGVIHTAIMNSMASRTYAFETFRNRSDLTIFRDADISVSDNVQYQPQVGARFHTVDDERVDPSSSPGEFGTARDITFFPLAGAPQASGSGGSSSSQVVAHNSGIFSDSPTNHTLAVSPAWVMVGYGICLNATCGDGGP